MIIELSHRIYKKKISFRSANEAPPLFGEIIPHYSAVHVRNAFQIPNPSPSDVYEIEVQQSPWHPASFSYLIIH